MIDTKSAVSQRLSKYAVLSATAAVAATGTASAAVQIVTLGTPITTTTTGPSFINIGAQIFSASSTGRQIMVFQTTGGTGGVAANAVAAAFSDVQMFQTFLRYGGQVFNGGNYNATGWVAGDWNFATDPLFYVGFRTTKGGATHYGWLEFTRNNATDNYTISQWAYETSAGVRIATPGTAPAAVPGGAGLAALAFGAAGLRGRRRGRD